MDGGFFLDEPARPIILRCSFSHSRVPCKHHQQHQLGPVHTMRGKFENAALFLRLGLTSTLIRHENKAFRKRSSKRRNLRTTDLCFSVDGKHFENGAFRKQWPHDNHMHVISLPEFSSNTNPKWPVSVAFSNSPSVMLCKTIDAFSESNAVFKFLRRSVVGGQENYW